MNKYNVEMRENSNEEFQNWIGDTILAKSEEDALDLAFTWLIENGYNKDLHEIEYRVLLVERWNA